MKAQIVLLSTFFLLASCSNDDTNSTSNNYFPPINNSNWETLTLIEAGFNQNNIPDLLQFLEQKNTKGFIILKNGKLVMEHYFNNHNANSQWYWASAGKTLTAATIGIAQYQGFLNINNSVSSYLGNGWTSATNEQEIAISCKNLLNMTTGLDDSLGENTSAANLQYVAPAGTRWAYHNVYVKLQDIISQTTSTTFNSYFNTELKNKIGMDGNWTQIADNSVYISTTRSMARFGLLALHNGKWEDNQIVPENYFIESTNASQSLNKSYGYLWWLNGKESFRLPQSQLEFNGSLIPNAPADMVAALGKNDQKIYIIPSKQLVIIRMGQAADEENFALSTFDNELWSILNTIIN